MRRIPTRELAEQPAGFQAPLHSPGEHQVLGVVAAQQLRREGDDAALVLYLLNPHWVGELADSTVKVSVFAPSDS